MSDEKCNILFDDRHFIKKVLVRITKLSAYRHPPRRTKNYLYAFPKVSDLHTRLHGVTAQKNTLNYIRRKTKEADVVNLFIYIIQKFICGRPHWSSSGFKHSCIRCCHYSKQRHISFSVRLLSSSVIFHYTSCTNTKWVPLRTDLIFGKGRSRRE